MRQSRVDLVAPTLQFDRDGRHLLVATTDELSVVPLGGNRATLRLAVPGIRAVAGFADQVWVMASGGERLVRFDHDGRRLGDDRMLPASDEPWMAAPCGPPGVVCDAFPALGVLDDLGGLGEHRHADADRIVPLTARRSLSVSGSRVTLPSGILVELPHGTRILGGMILGDGKLAVLASGSTGRRHLDLLALGTGQVVARRELPCTRCWVAARHPVAVIQLAPRTIDVVDLRSGRSRGTLDSEVDIDEVAIDPEATRVALRSGRSVELIELGERLSVASPRSAVAGEPQPDARAAREEAPGSVGRSAAGIEDSSAPAAGADVAADPEDIPSAPLVALAPRRAGEPLARAAALACLDVERTLVLARSLVGIADGWDTRRLGYANESAHPFELEVAALVGTSRGRAAGHLAEARRRLAVARAERDAERSRTFVASPLGELAQEFALTPLDAEILMTAAAATLWGETARLFAVLANDAGRAAVDEMLIEQVLAADGEASRYDIAEALGPDGTLRRHGLLLATSDRPRPFTQLTVSPIVVARLRAEPPPLPEAIRIHASTRDLEALVLPRAELAAIVGELATPQAEPVRIVVRGRRGSGRRTVLAAIAARANRALGVIDLDQLAPGERVPRLRALLRSASLCGLLPCLIGSAEEDARAIQDAIAAHPGAVTAALGVDEPARFPPGHLELALPVLGAGQRLAHWNDVIARHGLSVADPERLSSRYRLTVGMVERAATQVALRHPGKSDATQALEDAVRQGRDSRLVRLASRVTRLPRWSDVVLPPEVLDSLRELIGRVQHGRRVYEDWGFDAVMTTGRGLTALFDGRPGTGKTMVAGIIARELGLDLYRVDVSRLVSKWIGETEKNLAEIFDAVDDGQAIILFDEADSLFARRTEVRSSNDRYANLEVNYLLQRIDAFDGIAILTTNFGSAIDPAFKRRVSFRLSFPFPDEEAREQLWRVHLPKKLPIEGELDLPALARRFQLAGGYIRNACLRAAFLAAQEETNLAQRHLERAVQLEYQQSGKISTSGPVD